MRRRGGQPGNRNRLVHGRYARIAVTPLARHRQKIRELRRRCEELVAMAELELRFRRDFAAALRAEAL